MNEQTLTTALRFLLDGKEPKEIAEVLVEILGDRSRHLSDAIAHANHEYAVYTVSPEWFEEELSDTEREFVGPRAELEKAASEVCNINLDSFYEHMCNIRDEYIEEWDKKGFIKSIAEAEDDSVQRDA